MPIKRCTLPNGDSGYKYGDSGKCYRNRKDAVKQMRAIKWRKSQAYTKEEIQLVLEELASEIDVTEKTWLELSLKKMEKTDIMSD